MQLLNKDFYHLSAGTIEVKSNTPNNVAFKVTGKSSHDNATSGAVRTPILRCDTMRCEGIRWLTLQQIEGKYTDKANGEYPRPHNEDKHPGPSPVCWTSQLDRIRGPRLSDKPV